MSLLQWRFPNEGRHADKIVVVESPHGEVAFRDVAKSQRYGFNGSRPVLFRGHPECQRFAFEGLQSDLPPGCGVSFTKGPYFHPYHSRTARNGAAKSAILISRATTLGMERIEKTVFISYRRTNIPWALACAFPGPAHSLCAGALPRTEGLVTSRDRDGSGQSAQLGGRMACPRGQYGEGKLVRKATGYENKS